MKLADEGAHHLASAAADFIDLLAGEYGDEADLTAFVVIAEVKHPNGEEGTSLVRWEHDTSWAHAAGLTQAASHGLMGMTSSDD